jgi:hypothetical protein
MIERRVPISISRLDDGVVTVHNYPYDTLPRLKSHLHPKFVIFNAGKKLERMLTCPTNLIMLFHDYPALRKIQALYDAWIAPIPGNSINCTSYNDPTLKLVPEVQVEDDPNYAEDHDYHSNRTKSNRGTGFCLRPRTRSVAAGEQDVDGDVNGTNNKKRKVLSESFTHNQQPLSEATLSRINEQYGEAAWTSDRIRRWAFRRKRKVIQSLY